MWKSMEEMTVLQGVQAPKICKYLAMFMSIALIVQAAGFMFWFPLAQPLYYLAIILSLMYILGGGIAVDERFMIFMILLGINALLLSTDPIFDAIGCRVFFLFFGGRKYDAL